MNAVTNDPKVLLQGQKAGRLARLAADILRGKSLDGRDLEAISANGMLDLLFAEEACPLPGRFAYWASEDGSRWLFVERERVDRKMNYIVAVGDMGESGREITISALCVINEKSSGRAAPARKYEDGALFIDRLEVEGRLELERRIDEPTFVSHARPSIWKAAPRFNSSHDAITALPGASAADSLPNAEERVEEGQGEGESGDDGPTISVDDDGSYKIPMAED